MKFRLYHIALCLSTASCGGIFLTGPGDPGGDPKPNRPVLANAGADREILRGYPTRLLGDGTYSPAGAPFTVQWQQVSGQAVHLSNQNSADPSFLAPLEEQDLVFRLTADDGQWTTADEVTLRVRRQPSLVAPRVYAGPDRYLAAGETEPGPSDIASLVGDDVTTVWLRIEVGDSPHATEEPAHSVADPQVFRLTATRGGLGSTPDYLLLYPFDLDRLGDRAPTAALVAPAMVVPGQLFTLDAALSTDANGDVLRLRWEQAHGEPLLDTPAQQQTLSLFAPTRPQELVFRAFANDGRLESAPAQVSIVVSSAAEAPAVAPQRDSRTHPGNNFWLDADGLPTAEETPEISFLWAQTYGPSVVLDLDESGRFATFVAPATEEELAFSVVAEVAQVPVPVQGDPDVARVTVVDPSDNLPPNVYLCYATATIDSELRYVVTALIADPEADALEAPDWSLEADPHVDLSLRERGPEEIIDSAMCGVQRGGPFPEWSSLATVLQADFAPPTDATTVTVGVSLCDDLAACGENATQITFQ